MAFLRFRTASPSVPTVTETLTGGLSSEQIDGNFKSLNDSKAENNGTGASGTWSINISGNAATATSATSATSAATWTTARTLTIGSTGKPVNGSANVAWSLSEIGAAATNQTMFIGTTSVAINRSSGVLGLTGITSLSSGSGLSSLSIFSTDTTSENSGALTLKSGNTTTSGSSGTVTVSSGSGSGTNRSGTLNLLTGDTSTGTSGDIYILTGTPSGEGASGDIFIKPGLTKIQTTNAGAVKISGGNTSNAVSANNGHVYINAGSAQASTGIKYGGKVYIDGGRPASGGTIVDDGAVLIGTQDNIGSSGTRTISIGHANTTTTVTGAVSLPTVGTSGFVKLGASGALSADTNSYALTNQSFFIGTTSVAINRTSASLSLTGVSIDGNAGTATTLQNSRTIWGQSFNGSANVSGDLSGVGAITVGKSLFETRIAVAASNIDLSLGNMFTRTISTATTLTVSNVPASGTVASFILDLTNGGAASITWWSGVKWAEGTAPTLTTSGRDVLGFFTHDGGTTWTGLLLGKDVK